jgi:hypothetical protein
VPFLDPQAASSADLEVMDMQAQLRSTNREALAAQLLPLPGSNDKGLSLHRWVAVEKGLTHTHTHTHTYTHTHTCLRLVRAEYLQTLTINF